MTKRHKYLSEGWGKCLTQGCHEQTGSSSGFCKVCVGKRKASDKAKAEARDAYNDVYKLESGFKRRATPSMKPKRKPTCELIPGEKYIWTRVINWRRKNPPTEEIAVVLMHVTTVARVKTEFGQLKNVDPANLRKVEL